MKNNLIYSISHKIIFYGLFLFSTNLVSAMQGDTNFIILADRFITDAAKSCSKAIKIKNITTADFNSSLNIHHNEAKRDFSSALQLLLNAHETGHKTALLLAKRVFDIMQKIESIRLEHRKVRAISLSPEIAETLSKFKKYDSKKEELSWQEFAHESCDSKDYADYARLNNILEESMNLLHQ